MTPLTASGSAAVLPPYLVRSILSTCAELGANPQRLCLGLGFGPEDLVHAHCRLSFRQVAMLVERATALFPTTALGLMVGERQSIASIGLVGFAMLTCRTLQDAAQLGIQMQREAGSMLQLQWVQIAQRVQIHAHFLHPMPAIHPFLVEEAFSSWLGLIRAMHGHVFKPLRIELAYPAPAWADEYQRCFGCPIDFNRPTNIYHLDRQWVQREIQTFDPHTHSELVQLLQAGIARERAAVDWLTTLERHIGQDLHTIPTLHAVAARMHTSERTLRRRLAAQQLSYQSLVDGVRKERAIELLSTTDASIDAVADAVGFSDAHNFRRAFKRWTGDAPSALRNALKPPPLSAGTSTANELPP